MHAITARLDPYFSTYLHRSQIAVAWIAGAGLCTAVGVNGLNVMLRYVWDAGLVWHQEVALLAAFFVYFPAYSLIAKSQGYIFIEAFLLLVPPRVQHRMVLVNRVFVIAFHAMMFVFCLEAIDLVRNEVTWIIELPESMYFVPLTIASLDIFVTEVVLFMRAAWGEQSLRQSSAAAI